MAFCTVLVCKILKGSCFKNLKAAFFWKPDDQILWKNTLIKRISCFPISAHVMFTSERVTEHAYRKIS